ncbi:nucleotide exchange factor GrpE [Lacticaseibacillus parakribbianus]|uniref:nucleotide exchange factor GrpE n=1 Tax=Lacticaseibacillus parakribbianus TaxID=2970927 RepID=UPI0021CB3555|nr:nucleotide exchange factor GrpE [Lacticaseibacillus parakribbianus]
MTKKEKETQPDEKQAQPDAAPKQSLKDEIAAEMAADLDAQVKEDAIDVPALQKERDELEDKYLRAAAEISNMNNRFKKERAQLLKYDGQKLAAAVLPVLDNLERALQTPVDADSAQSLKKGVEMVYSHLETALKDNAVTEIDATAKFDPTLHQAVQTVPASADHPKDTVVQVLQKGYMLKDRVLRPAMVVVAN